MDKTFLKFNRVFPQKATINTNKDTTFSLKIIGVDSYNEEMTVASYPSFPSRKYAEAKAMEWRVPKSRTAYFDSSN